MLLLAVCAFAVPVWRSFFETQNAGSIRDLSAISPPITLTFDGGRCPPHAPRDCAQATATESRGPAQIFTGGDFNLSTTSATFTPDPSANGGYDVCTSSFSLFNTTAAQQVVLNNTDFTVFHLSEGPCSW